LKKSLKKGLSDITVIHCDYWNAYTCTCSERC